MGVKSSKPKLIILVYTIYNLNLNYKIGDDVNDELLLKPSIFPQRRRLFSRSGISPGVTWELWFRLNGFLLAALAAVGVFSVVVVLLLCCHLYLVSTNCTTWEFMSRHRISYLKNCGNEENPFDRGVFCNLWDFFCICRTVAWEQMYHRNAPNSV